MYELLKMEVHQIVYAEGFQESNWRLECCSRAATVNRNHQVMFQVGETTSFARFLLVTNRDSGLSQQRDGSSTLSVNWLMI